MSGSLWLDDVLLPKKPKENVLKQPQEFTYTTDTVILDESGQKNYLVDCDEHTSLQLQLETAEGSRIIPISSQHIITTSDGNQYLTGGIITDEQPGFLHTVEGGQTYVLSSEQGGQQVFQDSTGQQYIICDIPTTEDSSTTTATTPSAAAPNPPETFTQEIDSFISKSSDEKQENVEKQLVKLPNGPRGEYITYEVECQMENGEAEAMQGDKNILDQDKLANLLNVLQTGEHGQALSNADLFILVPPDQDGAKENDGFGVSDNGDIITDLESRKPNDNNSDNTKYVAVKMKKSDLNLATKPTDDKDSAIKTSTRTPSRKITEYTDHGFIKSKPPEETKADWEYSVFNNNSSSTTTNNTPKSNVKRKRGPVKKDKADNKQSKLEQMTLDFGQKVEPSQCGQCGMVYNSHVAEDDQNHTKYHKRFLKASSFSGWKNERVVEEYHDGRIISVNQHDPKAHIKKMNDIREIVDIDLGITDRNTTAPNPNLQSFLYISNANKVIAAAFVEHIEKGYPCISEHVPDQTGKLPLLKTSDDPMKAVCGISRLWVFKQCRRKKIASRLMDCVRANFVFGCTISKVKIAFSDPTESGRLFAQIYCGTSNFLIYR